MLDLTTTSVSYKPTTMKRFHSLKTFRRRGFKKRFVVVGLKTFYRRGFELLKTTTNYSWGLQ